MSEPKYKIGETVIWNGGKLKIAAIRNYQDYCWVYDFEPTKDTLIPFHFTGIYEKQIMPLQPQKRWWEFWK